MMINICFLSLRRTVTAANNSTSCLPMKKEFYAPRLWDLIKAKLDNAGGEMDRGHISSPSFFVLFLVFWGVLKTVTQEMWCLCPAHRALQAVRNVFD